MRKILGLLLVTVTLAIAATACGTKEETQASNAAAAAEQPEEKTEQPEEKTEQSEGSASDSEYLDKYGHEIIATAKNSLDTYLNGFRISLDPKDWTVAKYDDQDTVIALTEVTYHGSTGPYLYVGTLEIDDAGMVVSATHHYLESDGSVLLDDGYCEDISGLKDSLIGN